MVLEGIGLFVELVHITSCGDACGRRRMGCPKEEDSKHVSN